MAEEFNPHLSFYILLIIDFALIIITGVNWGTTIIDKNRTKTIFGTRPKDWPGWLIGFGVAVVCTILNGIFLPIKK